MMHCFKSTLPSQLLTNKSEGLFMTRRLLPYLALMLLAWPSIACDVAADDYRTPEYLAGRGLDAIHAAEAYALGYSGKGVTVGVLDTNAFPQHHEFFLKHLYPVEYFTTPKKDEWHGVHTVGTIAASRDNAGMHGVAYDAELVSMVVIDGNIPIYERGEKNAEAIRAFRNYPKVSIISNSWTYGLALAEWPGFLSGAADDTVKAATAIADMAKDADTLFVFAAANDGHASPDMPAALPALMTGTTVIEKTILPATEFSELSPPEKRALSLNMINVSAFDPGRGTNRLDFIAPFSNLTDGAAHFSLLAPGVDIYSTVGPGVEDYRLMSGTSMAAPHVAGAAALTKEAFPWMNGKQIADTLLSTAVYPATMNGLPPFLIQTCKSIINDEYVLFSVTAPKNVNSVDLVGHEEEIRRLWQSSGRAEHEALENFTARLAAAMDSSLENNNPNVQRQIRYPWEWIPKHIITPAQYMALFGMGVVNVGQAVRGPGWLDANRLSNWDKADYMGVGYAMYGVDTQGYDGVWSHDIGQVKVQSDGAYPNGVALPAPNAFNDSLADLDVGLRKQGNGRLTLTGANLWRGPTVVAGGEMALGRTGQADGSARLAGDVYVKKAGTFSGNGLVGGNLISEGLLRPGLSETPGSVLTVQGDVTSRGTLRLALDNRRANLLLVNGAADIAGTVIELPTGMKGGALPASVYEIIRATVLNGDQTGDSARVRQGVTLIHSYELQSGAEVLRAERINSVIMPQTKALSEGFVSGADLVAGPGIIEAVKSARAVREEISSGIGLATFGALSGGRQRHNFGSHGFCGYRARPFLC
jgi:subtilase-type serine protease